MSEIDALLQEFADVKEERERAEEEAMGCQCRLDEIKQELVDMGYTEELSMSAL